MARGRVEPMSDASSIAVLDQEFAEQLVERAS